MKKIALGGEKGKGLFAIIDDEDYLHVAQHSWHVHKEKHLIYVFSTIRNEIGKWVNVSLHRFIMSPTSNEVVDHIDGNGLNNQKSNLRICTQKENSRNRHKTFGTSKYKGVTFVERGCWEVSIRNNDGCSEYLGSYTNERDAALVYDKYALTYYGMYANLNFPDLREKHEELNVGYSNNKLKKSSQYTGVYWDKEKNKWATQITINRKCYHIGRFDDEDDAHEAYLYAKSHKDEVVNRR